MPLGPDEFVLDAPKEGEEFTLDLPKRRTPLQEIGRQVGLTARAGIEGIAAVPLAVAGAPVMIKRALGYPSGLTPQEGLSSGLSAIGLPEPEGAGERLVQDVAGGMAGTGGIGAAMKAPVTLSALLSGGLASGAGGAARELGAPPWAQSLASLATGIRGRAKITPESIRNPENIERMNTWEAANKAGYKFPPSTIERGMGRERLEDLAGKAALKGDVALHNAQVTKKLAKQGAGLKPDEILNEENLAIARDRLAWPYKEVASLYTKGPKDIADWKEANAEAKLYWNDYERNHTASAFKEYERWKNKADAALDKIEMEASFRGREDLVKSLKDARVAIAQNWDVDRALNIGTGEVRADVLGRMLDKRGAKGMTGPLGLIAKTQQAFPQYMGETAKTTTPGVHALTPFAAAALGLEGYHLGGWPGAAAGVSLPFARAGARGIAMSPFMQQPRQAGAVPLSSLLEAQALQNLRNERPDSGQ